MYLRRKKFQKIENYSIFLCLVLLSGILTISYGVFNHFNPALYFGLAITIAGSIMGLFATIFIKNRLS